MYIFRLITKCYKTYTLSVYRAPRRLRAKTRYLILAEHVVYGTIHNNTCVRNDRKKYISYDHIDGHDGGAPENFYNIIYSGWREKSVVPNATKIWNRLNNTAVRSVHCIRYYCYYFLVEKKKNKYRRLIFGIGVCGGCTIVDDFRSDHVLNSDL